MENMLAFIKKYPEMIVDAVETTKNAKLPRYDFKKIIVCGMGSSSTAGVLLTDFLRHISKIPVEVSRRYELPKHADKDTLVFFVSYSGNTEETLSQFVEARKRALNMVCMSSGGQLKKWCDTFSIPFVKLPDGFVPRMTLMYSFFPMLQYLNQSVDELDFSKDIEETIKILDNLRTDMEKEDKMRSIVGLIRDSRIVVYGTDEFEGAVRRVKTQINENSKLPASFDVFPELNHTEIVGYEDNDLNKDVYILLFRDDEIEKNESMKTRIETTMDIIKSKVKGVVEIHSVGKSKLARMMSIVYYGDLLSYYLAREGEKVPEKTEYIDKLKAVLKEKINLQDKLKKEVV